MMNMILYLLQLFKLKIQINLKKVVFLFKKENRDDVKVLNLFFLIELKKLNMDLGIYLKIKFGLIKYINLYINLIKK